MRPLGPSPIVPACKSRISIALYHQKLDEEERNSLELEGIFTPHLATSVQGSDRDCDRVAFRHADCLPFYALLVYPRCRAGDLVRSSSDANCARDGGVQAEDLAHDAVEVRKRIEIVHGGIVAEVPRKKLFAQKRLNVRGLGKSEESPRCCGTVYETLLAPVKQ